MKKSRKQTLAAFAMLLAAAAAARAYDSGVALHWLGLGLVASIVLIALLWLGQAPPVLAQIEQAIAPSSPSELTVARLVLPHYRYADIYRAAERWAKEHEATTTSLLHAGTWLATLLADGPQLRSVIAHLATSESFSVAPGTEELLPLAQMWMCNGSRPWVLRVWRAPHEGTLLEFASKPEQALQPLAEINASSLNESVFRGHFLSFRAESGNMIDDGYGLNTGASLRFNTMAPVTDADIILPDETRAILQRNVIDLWERREALSASGVPLSRGVLLYGPPGTGKSYTCRYLAGKLEGVTVIGVAGVSLTRISEVFELARGLAPSLLILEDVDLVFESREHNQFGAPLGTLMDELDGLSDNANVSVVMTTNSIDRLEAAIKDRPGRISQAIYYGPPSEALRRLYLERAFGKRDLAAVDLDALVRMSADTTQAFLREWVLRGIQFASEGKEHSRLRTHHFEEALAEMTDSAEGASRIVGFRV